MAIIGKLYTFTPSLVPQAGPERVLLVLSHFAGVMVGLFRDTPRACRWSCLCSAGPVVRPGEGRELLERPSRILPALTAGLLRRGPGCATCRLDVCAPFWTMAAGAERLAVARLLSLAAAKASARAGQRDLFRRRGADRGRLRPGDRRGRPPGLPD